MRHLIIPVNICERGNLISLIEYKPNLKEIIQTKAVRKFIGLRNHMKPISPKKLYKGNYFSSATFFHLYPSLINILTGKFTLNKPEKTPTFTGVTPTHVTILTILESIRTSQDGMADNYWRILLQS